MHVMLAYLGMSARASLVLLTESVIIRVALRTCSLAVAVAEPEQVSETKTHCSLEQGQSDQYD